MASPAEQRRADATASAEKELRHRGIVYPSATADVAVQAVCSFYEAYLCTVAQEIESIRANVERCVRTDSRPKKCATHD